MATNNSLRAAGLDDDAEIVASFHGASNLFVGQAAALIEAWLILPQWVPGLPNRVVYSSAFPDRRWWGNYDESEEQHQAPQVAGWVIRRVKNGLFALKIWPISSSQYPGGPIDTEMIGAAVAVHRRMVRARRDRQFQEFVSLAGLVAT